MKLSVYQTPDKFLQVSQDYLLRLEALDNLMLGLALRMLKAPERFKRRPFFATVSDESDLVAAAIMAPPNNLVLYCARDNCGRAIQMMAEELHAHDWRVPGVVGFPDVSKSFAETWARSTGVQYWLSMSQGIFELREVIPPRPTRGDFRGARAADVELVTQWACAFQKEALLHSPDPNEVREHVALRIGDGDVFVWQDGQLASMAFRARPTLTGISIGSVYTPPDLRGRGYASACVAALSQLCLDSGYKFCMLYTDLANPTSNSIYQKIGYRPIGESSEYRFGDADQ